MHFLVEIFQGKKDFKTATRFRGSMFLALLVLFTACSGPGELAPDDHVVRAPISEKADVILANLLEKGMVGNRWRDEMSPGCSTIWATQFGFRSGLRRGRDDLVFIGEVTAAAESSALRTLFWNALFGDFDAHDAAIPGLPALLVSAALNDDAFHAWLFSTAIDDFVEKAWDRALRSRENAGMAALLAELYRIDPKEHADRLDQARYFAGKLDDRSGIVYHAIAWSAIARATGSEGDLERARAVAARAMPAFDPGTGEIGLPEGEKYHDVLSAHLALIHAFADLAQADPTGDARRQAMELLDYVFSDAYFDGKHIMHDRIMGDRSEDFCSGCNFMALYLADRLYGDCLFFTALPEIRLDDPVEPSWHRLSRMSLTSPATHSFASRLPRKNLSYRIGIETAEGDPSATARTIRIEISANDGPAFGGTLKIEEEGAATFRTVYTFEDRRFRFTIEFNHRLDEKFPYKLMVEVEEDL